MKVLLVCYCSGEQTITRALCWKFLSFCNWDNHYFKDCIFLEILFIVAYLNPTIKKLSDFINLDIKSQVSYWWEIVGFFILFIGVFLFIWQLFKVFLTITDNYICIAIGIEIEAHVFLFFFNCRCCFSLVLEENLTKISRIQVTTMRRGICHTPLTH